MSVSERLKSKVDALPKFRPVEFMGELCLAPRMSLGAKRRAFNTFMSDDASEMEKARVVSGLLLDPETEEPVFSAEYIMNEMPDETAIELLRAVFGLAVESAEKN